MSASPEVIRAVTVDLDDTLFPQEAWLSGAWEAVAVVGRDAGLPAAALLAALRRIAAEGSDKGGILDRALADIGVCDAEAGALKPRLLAAFRGHAPAELTPYPGVVQALAALRTLVPVACITDGDPAIQRAKLVALGLDDAFDEVVVSDEFGRAHRKPDPLPFRRALQLLDVAAKDTVHVGDRPAKDVVGAAAVGMRCVRVRTGEYARLDDAEADAPAWRIAPDAATALRQLAAEVADDAAGVRHALD